MNNCNNFISTRNRELYSAYRSAFRSPDIRSHQQAVKTAVTSPASRFYISTFQAYREILKLKKGKPSTGMRGVRKRMINHIYSIYKDLEGKPTFRGCSTYFITSFAVQHSAPEFYLSYSRALAIISKMNRKNQNEK